MNRIKLVLTLVACTILTATATSCIPRDDDSGPEPTQEDTLVIDADTTHIDIDTVFIATADDLLGEWMAHYTGYDPMQSEAMGDTVISSIRRQVVFSPEGSYDSHVQGILDIRTDTAGFYREFEHEHGTYTVDRQKQMLAYTVEYDSLLNFGTDAMERHPGKVLRHGTAQRYGERIVFTKEHNGSRNWVRTDDNLMATDDYNVRLIYIMKRHK